jgi:hypothetical protein
MWCDNLSGHAKKHYQQTWLSNPCDTREDSLRDMPTKRERVLRASCVGRCVTSHHPCWRHVSAARPTITEIIPNPMDVMRCCIRRYDVHVTSGWQGSDKFAARLFSSSTSSTALKIQQCTTRWQTLSNNCRISMSSTSCRQSLRSAGPGNATEPLYATCSDGHPPFVLYKTANGASPTSGRIQCTRPYLWHNLS